HYPSLFLSATLPPRSTPFPYTTLFRSLFAGSAFATQLVNSGGSLPLLPDLPDPDGSYYASLFRDRLYPLLASKSNSPYVPRGTADRKSTRLNSSHVKISYAVCCLKKKT